MEDMKTVKKNFTLSGINECSFSSKATHDQFQILNTKVYLVVSVGL